VGCLVLFAGIACIVLAVLFGIGGYIGYEQTGRLDALLPAAGFLAIGMGLFYLYSIPGRFQRARHEREAQRFLAAGWSPCPMCNTQRQVQAGWDGNWPRMIRCPQCHGRGFLPPPH
jgi:hypothetical protein